MLGNFMKEEETECTEVHQICRGAHGQTKPTSPYVF